MTGEVDIVGPVGVTGNVSVVGDVGITGDLVLNGISLAEVSAGLKPTEVVIRNCNPLCPGLWGGEEPPKPLTSITSFPASDYPYNFIGGWPFKKESAGNDKINWNFIPGSINTRIKDFKGFNINIFGYSNVLPFVTIYTRNATGGITPGKTTWYENRITFIPSNIDSSKFSNTLYGKPQPYPYTITYGDYDNTLIRGYHICESTITNEMEANTNLPLTSASLSSIPNDIITSYVVQTTESTTGYMFILNTVNVTEIQEVSGKTYQTVFSNHCTQMF